MVCVLDHVLLTASTRELRTDQEKIEYIALELIKLKKEIYKDGGKALFLILSQENRKAKEEGRIKNPSLHFPMVSDIFASSTLEMASDAMISIKIPDTLKIENYGPGNFPTVINYNGEPIPMAYMHVIKNRAGKNNLVIPLVNKLQCFSFEEMESELWEYIHSEFNEKGFVNIKSE